MAKKYNVVNEYGQKIGELREKDPPPFGLYVALGVIGAVLFGLYWLMQQYARLPLPLAFGIPVVLSVIWLVMWFRGVPSPVLYVIVRTLIHFFCLLFGLVCLGLLTAQGPQPWERVVGGLVLVYVIGLFITTIRRLHPRTS